MAEQSQTKKKYTVGKTVLMILLFSVSIVSLMCGLVISFGYVRLKLVCTSEITGVVTEVSTDSIESIDSIETKYLNEYDVTLHIALESDGVFPKEMIYCDAKHNEDVGTKMTIHYSPKDPEDYYINNWFDLYKLTGIVVLGLAILSYLSFGYIRRSSKAINVKDSRQDNEIAFVSPYGRFVLYDKVYECNIPCEWNSEYREEVYIYLECDSPDDINPTKCYERFEEFISNGEQTAFEIKKKVAEHFMSKPELFKEGSSVESLMEDINFSSVYFYRNGETDFNFHDPYSVFVREIYVKYKSDGTKEITYFDENGNMTTEAI